MRRADRLFRIVEYLKARRQVVRADDLAHELEVSTRTIYRDIADLSASGVPIIGEAGVGYILDKDYVVRPLMFDIEELEALALGAQMVKSWSDKDFANSAKSALDKISAALPDNLRQGLTETALFSYTSASRTPITFDFSSLRRAIRTKHYISFEYTREDNTHSKRQIRPLALVFFAPVWLLTGWCDLRSDFRNFRLDRMDNLEISDQIFRDEKGKRLTDYEETCT